MKKVIAHYSKPAEFPTASIFLKPLNAMWVLTGALLPFMLIYGTLLYGSPALLIEEKHGRCAYLDLLGGFYTNPHQGQCTWYGFRDLKITTTFNQLIWE